MPQVIVNEGVVFGATHLFEGSARLNEYLSMKTRLKTELPGYPTYNMDEFEKRDDVPPSILDKLLEVVESKFKTNIDRSLNQDTSFHGIYGTARKLFYEQTGASPCYRADIVFATIIDCALNPPLPPLNTLQVTEEIPTHFLVPSLRFVETVKAARDFDLRSEFDPEKNTVQQIVSDFYAFLKEKRIAVAPHFVVEDGLTLFGALRFTNIPDDLYELRSDGSPKQKTKEGRLIFIAKRIFEAMSIRMKQPDLFILPFDVYMKKPQQFDDLLNRINFPLWSLGSELRSTSAKPGWFEYFFISAVAHDLLRWVVYCDAAELAKRAAKYIHAVPFPGYDTGQLVYRPLDDILGRELLKIVFEAYQRISGAES